MDWKEVKDWANENKLGIGGILGSIGLGFFLGQVRKKAAVKKALKYVVVKENEAYFVGMKDGAIRTLESMLKQEREGRIEKGESK